MNNFKQISEQLRDLFFANQIKSSESVVFFVKLGFKATDQHFPFLLLIADVLNIEVGNRGLARCFQGLRELFESAGERIDLTDDEQVELFIAIDLFEKAVSGLPGKNLNREPQKIDNMVIYFLTKTRAGILRKSDFSVDGDLRRWKQTCLAGYRALRIDAEQITQEKMSEAARNKRKNSASVAVEYVLRNIPADAWNYEKRTDFLFGEICDAIRYAGKHERVTIKKYRIEKNRAKLKTLQQSRRIAISLFDVREYRWKPYRARSTGGSMTAIPSQPLSQTSVPGGSSTVQQSPNSNQTASQPIPKSSVYNKYTDDLYSREKQIEAEEGEAEIEFDYLEEVPSKKFSPKGSLAWSLACQPAGLTPVWAKGSLTVELLGVLVSVIRQKAVQNPQSVEHQMVLCFIEMMIFFGFQPSDLEGMQFAPALPLDGSNDKNNPVLSIFDGRVYIRPRRENEEAAFAFSPFDQVRKKQHLDAKHLFSLPIPSFINKHLEFIKSQTAPVSSAPASDFISKNLEPEVFSWVNNGKPQKLSRKNIDKYLGKTIKNFERLSSAEITTGKIAVAVNALHCRELKAGELLTAFLRGSVPRHLASQAHYTSYALSFLQEESLKIHEETIKNILGQSRSLIAELQLPPIDNYWVSTVSAAEQQDDQPEHLQTKDPASQHDLIPENYDEADKQLNFLNSVAEPRVGSPFVPLIDTARKFLGDLTDQAANSADWRHEFNCLTALTAVKLMIFNALRAVEIKRLTDLRVYAPSSSGESMLAIEAKFNQRFKEWRVIKISDETKDELEEFIKARSEIIGRLFMRSGKTTFDISAARQMSFFFFIRRNELPLPVTTENFREFFNTPEHFSDGFFGKINFGRHLWRTVSANQLHLNDNFIDRQTGHTTKGREPLGAYSLHDWRKSNAVTRETEVLLRKVLL